MVEFMHSFEMLTRISGNPLWADRCEEIAFNSLPAALSPDHKGIHYITSPNSIELDVAGKRHGQFGNGAMPMQAYEPGVHNYRCCPHNYGMGWPYYSENSWLATADNGLCASLYTASEVKAKVADGSEVKITEETDYPFADTIHLKVSSPKNVSFPLYLRVPRWCKTPAVKINGNAAQVQADPLTYIVVQREWADGDTVDLQLPMNVAVRTWTKNNNSVSVDYGPLSFSLDIGEKWNKTGGTDAWPQFEVIPTTAWNYGLEFDPQNPAASFEIVRKPGPVAEQPFTHEGAPLSLRARARKIPGWQVDADKVVGVLKPSPARSTEPEETVSLIPMGAARLRITSFPTIGTGDDAHDWAVATGGPKPSASYCNGGDTVDALNSGNDPANSDDESIPRLTWWDHKGTSEWAQYDFDKPATFSAVSVYWFDDTGHGACRVPASWKLLCKDGDTWKPVDGASDYGVVVNKYNRVTFTPAATSALRVQVQLQDNVSGGILQWRFEQK
jgi:hypothetical protein